MFEISEEEKELALNSVDYFTDIFFACRGGKLFVKLLAAVIQTTTLDAGFFGDDRSYCNKEEFKGVVKMTLRVLVERA